MSPPRTLTADLLHDGQATLAEGPRWDSRTDRLIWVDILAGETHFLDRERTSPRTTPAPSRTPVESSP
jgi:sugar lactone lactonase YvrE